MKKFIVIFLCFLIVALNFSVVCFADDNNSIDVYDLSAFIALCGACGVTFNSVVQAQNFYNQLAADGGGSASFSDFDDMIDMMANDLKNFDVDELVGSVIQFSLLDDCVAVLNNFGEMIANKFGLSDGVYIKSVHVPSNGLDMNNTDDRIIFKIPIISNEITSTIIGNLKIYALWGSMKSYFDLTDELSENSIYPTSTIFYYDICDGLFECRTYQNLVGSYSDFYYDYDLRWSSYGSTYDTILGISSIDYSYYGDGIMRFNGDILNNEFVDGIYRRYFTANGNIVDTSTGCLRGTNIRVPIDVVNRGGLWYNWEFAIFLNGLIFDGDFVNIDTAFLPGGDIPDFDVAYAEIDPNYFDNTSVPVVLPSFSSDGGSLVLSDNDVSAFTPFSARGAVGIVPDLSFNVDGSNVNATGGGIGGGGGGGGSSSFDIYAKPFTSLPNLSSMSPAERLFKTKFPFCLPYDVYKLVVGFRAEPVAPVIHVPVDVGVIDDYSFDIDFSDFEQPIVVFRWFVAAVFVAGLIYATKRFLS